MNEFDDDALAKMLAQWQEQLADAEPWLLDPEQMAFMLRLIGLEVAHELEPPENADEEDEEPRPHWMWMFDTGTADDEDRRELVGSIAFLLLRALTNAIDAGTYDVIVGGEPVVNLVLSPEAETCPVCGQQAPHEPLGGAS